MEPKYEKSLSVFPSVTFYQVDDKDWWYDCDEEVTVPAGPFGPFSSLEVAAREFTRWVMTPI